MKRCIIFSAGTYYGLPFKPDEGDFIICADAGYIYCEREGIKPDLILGDFDSAEMPCGKTDILQFPVEKDDTDTMLAVKTGLRKGFKEFHILGGTGGSRSDHTIANLLALCYIAKEGGRGVLHDKSFIYTAIMNGEITLERKKDWGIISIFAIGGRAEGVSLSGVQYPLEKGSLDSFFPLGVSNHFTENTARICVEKGCLLIGMEI